jgi:predicted DNA-binding protein
MANVATVSFKLSPEGYAVLKAMAAGEGRSVSEFVRATVTEALELEREVERLVEFFTAKGDRRGGEGGRR